MTLSLFSPSSPRESAKEPSAIVDIVLVHGIGGHAYRSWTEPATAACWPRDFLPAEIPFARVLTFGYTSSIAPSTPEDPISLAASWLIKELISFRKENDAKRPVIFVAHSLGGLVVKEALIRSFKSSSGAHSDICYSTFGLIFLGSPQTVETKQIKRVVDFLSQSGHRRIDQVTEKALLASLNHFGKVQERFLNIKPYNPFARVYSFYEELPEKAFGRFVVKKEAAAALDYLQIGLQSDHSFLSKFPSSNSVGYRQIVGVIKSLLTRSIGRINEPSLWGHSRILDTLVSKLKIENGSERIASALKGTGNWLLNHDKFISWLDGNQAIHSPLWITGKVGSGKSVLLRSITDSYFVTSNLSNRSITISYFFYSGPDSYHKSSEAILRSLLFQILVETKGDPTAFWSFLQRKRGLQRQLFNIDKPKRHSITQELGIALHHSITTLTALATVYIVIDALDECEPRDIVSVMSVLLSIQKEVPERAMRLLFSSREVHQLQGNHYLDQAPKINVDENNHQDILLYSQFRLSQFNYGGDIVQDLTERLAHRARGMFLWVKLVIDHVIHTSSDEQTLISSLPELPLDLLDLYQVIWERFERFGHRVQAVLRWVWSAQRPLSLRELEDALLIQSESPPIVDDYTKLANDSFEFTDTTSIWHLCCGLLEVRNYGDPVSLDSVSRKDYGSYTIQFIHESVKHFLSERWSEQATFPTAHMVMLQTCVYSMMQQPLDSFTSSKYLTNQSFAGYAYNNWYTHAQFCDLSENLVDDLLQILVGFSQSFSKTPVNSQPYFCADCKDLNILHIAARTGLINVTKRLIQRGCAVEDRDSHGFTPLTLAAERGHLAAVRMLLEAGADINSPGSDLTPLSMAIKQSHYSVISLLLERGANVNARDSVHGLTALHRAALAADVKICKQILASGAEPNDAMCGSTALAIAAASGSADLVKLLLSSGADFRIPDRNFGMSIVEIAAFFNHSAVVSTLISYNMGNLPLDTDSVVKALYCAVASGSSDIAKQLLLFWPNNVEFKAKRKELPANWAGRVLFGLLSQEGKSFQNGNGHDQDSPSPDQNSGQGQPVSNSSGSQKLSTKRRRAKVGDDDADHESDTNEKRKKTPKQLPQSSDASDQKGFACPYYKQDPERHSNGKCAGPKGWPSVHRMKEHLYSNHLIFPCDICQREFEDEYRVREHRRDERDCPLNERDYGAGFDRNQKEELKIKLTKKKCPTEVQRWIVTFKILFPQVPEDKIPSPFYENVSPDLITFTTICNETLRRELPRMLAPLNLSNEIVEQVINGVHEVQTSLAMAEGGSSRPLNNTVNAPLSRNLNDLTQGLGSHAALATRNPTTWPRLPHDLFFGHSDSGIGGVEDFESGTPAGQPISAHLMETGRFPDNWDSTSANGLTDYDLDLAFSNEDGFAVRSLADSTFEEARDTFDNNEKKN